MKNLEKENSFNAYSSEVVENIEKTTLELDKEYQRRHKVSEELYKDLKRSRYDLIFLIRSGYKEVQNEAIDLCNLIETKEKLTILKEKNDSFKELSNRIEYLYSVLGKVTSKVAFYASHVDYKERIEKSRKK